MAAGPNNEESDEWRFSLDDLDDDSEPVEASEDSDDEESADGSNIAGTLASDQPLEPGEIDLENAIFVVLGALLVVGLLAATILGI